MKCPKCKSKLRRVKVSIEGAKTKILSNQCPKCIYFNFEEKNQDKVLKELKEQHLKIRQKIIKLSNDRLGMYFNKHIVKSLDLRPGEEISISVPNKRNILINLES